MDNSVSNKPTITYTLITKGLIVGIVAISLMGILWIQSELSGLRVDLTSMRERLLDTHKEVIKKEVDKVESYLEFKKGQVEKQLEHSIKERVYEAHAVASNIIEQYKESKQPLEIKKMIKAALRPIRFNNGRGYFFAFNLEGVEELFADRPEMEGKNLSSLQNIDGQYVIKDMIDIAEKKEEGFYSYRWTRPNAEGYFPKIAYVKILKPINWVIGSGEYINDVKQDIQKEIIEYIEQISYRNDGYIFATRWDGVALTNPGKGKNNINVTDANGLKIVQELIRVSKQGSGYIEYVMPKMDGKRPDPKLAYVIGIPEWEWYVGTGIYIDEIETAILQKKSAAKKQIVRNILKIILILVALILFMGLFAIKVTRKSKRNIELITDFFSKAAVESTSINPDKIDFAELETIAHAANEMTKARRNAEEELRKSEERLTLALDSVNDAVWDWRVDTGDVYFSSRWYTMLGYDPYELPQEFETWRKLLHPDDLPESEQTIRAHLKSGEPFQIEFRMGSKDGRWAWILARGKTVERDDKGTASRMLGIHSDITERINYQDEQKIRIDLLNALHEQANLQTLIQKVTGLMQNWSGCEAVGIRLQDGEDYPYFETRGFPAQFVAAERYLCAMDKRGEIIRDCTGNPVLECMCGNVIQGRFDPALPFFTKQGSFWTNSTSDLLRSTTENDRQARTRNRCHGEGYESVALIPLTLGSQRIGLLQCNDTRRDRFDTHKIAVLEHLASSLAVGISQRQTSLALRESEEKYRSMMESMDEPTYICSREFVLEYMNPAMIRRLGYDATGELCYKAMHALDAKCPWCVHDSVMKGESVKSENVSPRDNRVYHISNSPIFHSNGEISKMTIFRDVTEKKEMEAHLQQSQKMEAIGTLAGGIAHDFNNILFPIVGHSEMLMEDVPKDSPFKGSLNEIYTSALRARDLVQQILAFSRQGENELKMMKMQPIIKEALKLIRSTIPTTISIHQNLQPDCGAVKADPTKIHQIVMNLTTNAYHAMEETGGELKVSLKKIELGRNHLINPDMAPGPYACLTVADTGIGMDIRLTEKIFDPFFTTKKKGKGTGMGLSVVHGIVKSLNGAIQVHSESGKGTEFHVYLPLAESSFETKESRIKEAIPGGNERILLVDDEDIIIKMEKKTLERLGYRVTSKTSSIEALEAFKNSPDKFDLVITDLAMPKMPGDRLAVELIKIRRDIPILLCTGFSERFSEETAKAMGIRGFLMKPVARAAMAKEVRRIFDHKPV